MRVAIVWHHRVSVLSPRNDGSARKISRNASWIRSSISRFAPQIEQAAYAAAWTCADRAADLAPTSVEAHHLRGASLAALGRDAEAQTAYALALALDPDDPETLRAVADFYINGKGERGRDALRLGLELAQRGSRRAQARRRKNQPLTADLAVLDLSRFADAKGAFTKALAIQPDDAYTHQMLGLTLEQLGDQKTADAELS